VVTVPYTVGGTAAARRTTASRRAP
jgi:hypothetical protein